ncbi:MAG: hypothetical protein KDC54_01000 [Lewinella sp.]|nr:hypothetical protein [Lewinella sp.]
MSLRKKANLIIYRFRERGLEVFLLNNEDEQQWAFPQGEVGENEEVQEHDSLIELDPAEGLDGKREAAYAVEGDWHEIPSLKGLLYHDALQLKDKLKGMEKGAYLTVKDAFKALLPHQYAFLKELKDILTDRNSLRDL